MFYRNCERTLKENSGFCPECLVKVGNYFGILFFAFITLFGMAGVNVKAKAKADQIINRLEIAPGELKCGFVVENGVPEEFYLYCDAYSGDTECYDAAVLDTQLIVSGIDQGKPISLNGKIVGEKSFSEYYVIKSADGFSFSKDIVIENISDSSSFEVLHKDNAKIIILAEVTAVHENAYDGSYSESSATCSALGKTEYDCAGCGKHIEDVKDIDPDAHEWDDWDIQSEATATKKGKAKHVCRLCGAVETVVVPMLYSKVYEPDTSWSMAATVAWRSDSSVIKAASSDIRPATAFVWLDKELKVYDRDGKLIMFSLPEYLDKTAGSIIPAFYIRDKATAKALKKYLKKYEFEDCFVVSTPRNKKYVKSVADLLHVRAMLDFTSEKSPDRKTLTEMVAAVNGAHGKVVLINAEAATHENVNLLQSLGATVWVLSPTDTKILMTVYTNGVNGVLVDDYNAAIKLEEFFNDDAPTLLKQPKIIGHRGDPSNYAENTLESALGAYAEGVDGIENDIMLSKDNEVFIRHDGTLLSLIGIDIPCGRSFTLEELKSYPYVWDGEYGIPASNEVNKDDPDYGKLFGGKLYGEDEGYEYRIPTLKEYYENFKDKQVVHVTEFKSDDPELVPAFKKLTDEYDAWDQVFTITFETSILDQIYKVYPEISIGSLMVSPEYRPLYDCYSPEELTEMTGSPEIALEYVYGELEKWNSVYAPANFSYGEEMVKAGRHRGLTVWLWTYTTSLKNYMAKDYLAAVDGMTTDEPWFASDFIEEIRTASEYTIDIDKLPKPIGITKAGKELTLSSAEAVKIEDINSDGSEMLMIWRYKAEMNIDGENFGYYYLYSNPFVVKKASYRTKPDIHKYKITVKQNSGNINKVTWDEIPGASGYSVYVRENGKDFFLQDLKEKTKVYIFMDVDGRYYISTGGKYCIYELDASSGMFTRTGKIKKSEIGKIKKAVCHWGQFFLTHN